MTRKCKFPDKKCEDRYYSGSRGLCCRLDEWKQKKKTCPYNSSIRSCSTRPKGQKELK